MTTLDNKVNLISMAVTIEKQSWVLTLIKF